MHDIIKRQYNININYPSKELPHSVSEKIVDLYVSNLLGWKLPTLIGNNGAEQKFIVKCDKNHKWVIDKKGKQRNVAYLCVKRALCTLKLDWKCSIEWLTNDDDDRNIEITLTPNDDNA
jgi:hypothetical protein